MKEIKRKLLGLIIIIVVILVILGTSFFYSRNPETNSEANPDITNPSTTTETIKEICGRYYQIVYDIGDPRTKEDDKNFTFYLTLKEDGTFILETQYLVWWGIDQEIVEGHYNYEKEIGQIEFYNTTVNFTITEGVWQKQESVPGVYASGEIEENKIIITYARWPDKFTPASKIWEKVEK